MVIVFFLYILIVTFKVSIPKGDTEKNTSTNKQEIVQEKQILNRLLLL